MNSKLSPFLILALGLSYACSQGQYIASEENLAVAPPPSRQELKLDTSAVLRLSDTSYGLAHILTPECWEDLVSSCDSEGGPKVTFPRKQKSSELPVVANYPLHFRFRSTYDQQIGSYTVRAPQNPDSAQAAVIVLGDRTPPQLRGNDKVWVLSLPPTRPGLSYRFLSEGDLWSRLQSILQAYPQLRKLPLLLLGTEEYAEEALRLAHQYRNRFDGVAFTGALSGTHYANLDNFPVVYLRGGSGKGIWDGSALIDRLQGRGSSLAFQWEGGWNEALQQLVTLQQQRPELPTYSFSDYQYSRPTPWLQVLAKEYDGAPAQIRGEQQGDTLVLHTSNVRRLSLKRNESQHPRTFTKIRWGDSEISAESVERSITLGRLSKNAPVTTKSRTPGGLENFYRNEPLVIVYEDNDGDSMYEQSARQLAERFAYLHFIGLPDTESHLPIVPLSLYKPSRFPKHRCICIGKQESFAEYLVLPRPESLLLAVHEGTNGHIQASLENLSIAANCSPKSVGSLQLAYLIAAPDAASLSALDQKFSLATKLLNEEDVQIWAQVAEGLVLVGKQSLDSTWTWNNRPESGIHLSQQNFSDWNHYLRELLVDATQQDQLAIPLLVDAGETPPTQLSKEELRRILPERDFALVTLKGSGSAEIGTKLLRGLKREDVWGLEDVLRPDSTALEIDPLRMRKQVRRMLVDVNALQRLSRDDLMRIDYTPVSHSLHEIVLDNLDADAQGFAKGLLRAAQR